MDSCCCSALPWRAAGRAALLREIARQWRKVGLYENSQDELTRPGDDWLSALPYTWIGLQLLVAPGRAERIVHGAVDNFSLPESASQAIFDLPNDTVEQLFDGATEGNLRRLLGHVTYDVAEPSGSLRFSTVLQGVILDGSTCPTTSVR